jgi:hypothetical protein
VLSQQFLVLRASEERLKAELAGASGLTMPEDLKAAGNEHPDVTGIWNGQIHQFESRLAALAGARSVIREKIAQLEAQIVGSEAQEKAYREQFDSVRKERESLTSLVERGLIAKPRYLQLERSGVGLEGQAAETSANIAKSRQAIAEQMQQISQLDNERMTKDLRDTQAKLLEVISADFRLRQKSVIKKDDLIIPPGGGADPSRQVDPARLQTFEPTGFSGAAAAEQGTLASIHIILMLFFSCNFNVVNFLIVQQS